MIKIFLVEDEVFALRTLHRKILDLQEDYEIVGTATDGTEALPKILAAKPAIVMTDIRMSDMDGLTLIQKMKEQKVSALPVIISGYQEFEYAKQAMRLGVEDYLLKPVELSELKECLQNCRQKLEDRYSRKNIYSFLIGDESFSLEQITSDDNFTLVYLIASNPLNNLETFMHPGTGYLPGTRIQKLFTENFPETAVFCFDGIFSNEKVILLNTSPGPRTEPALKKITALLEDHFSCPVTLYYTGSRAKSLTYDIQSARRGCVKNAVFGISGCSCTLSASSPSEDLTGTIELLSLLIHQEDYELIRSNLLRLFQRWQEARRTVNSCQSDLIFILNSLRQSFSVKKTADLDSRFFIENIMCFSSTPEELAGNFSQLLAELASAPRGSEESAPGGEEFVRRIEEYCQKNLSRTITLQLLANEMNVSKVYLCRIFKKYKNISPIDYFNRLKIERACELLRRFSSLPLQEISDTLGFNDVYYFSKVFKKITGISPSGYRKKETPDQTENPLQE